MEWATHIVGDTSKRFDQNLLNSFCELLQDSNEHCCFKFRRNRIQKDGSRKKKVPFWTGQVNCTFSKCHVKGFLCIASKKSLYVNVEWKGNIHHDVSEMKSRNYSKGHYEKR